MTKLSAWVNPSLQGAMLPELSKQNSYPLR